MHHRRVLQEKEKLLADIKRLVNYLCAMLLVFCIHRMKDHFASYDPMLKDLRNKYEVNHNSIC